MLTVERRVGAWWGLGLLLVLAFFLRVYYLDHQSLWYDEILSASAARSSFAEMLRVTADYKHPPLYFIGLTAWQRLAGSSEFGPPEAGLSMTEKWIRRRGRP